MPFSFEILGYGTGKLDSPQLRTMPEILIGILTVPFKVCSMTNCIGSPGTVFLKAQSGVGFIWKVQYGDFGYSLDGMLIRFQVLGL